MAAADKKAPREPTVLHTDETRLKVIDLYQQGYRLTNITAETGVPRATIYWILKREGIRTDRIARSTDESLSISDLLDVLRRTEQELGKVRAELDRERNVVRWFMERVAIDPAMADELTAKPPRSTATT